MDVDRKPGLVGELLQFHFPEPHARPEREMDEGAVRRGSPSNVLRLDELGDARLRPFEHLKELRYQRPEI